MSNPLVSVIVPTKNSAQFLMACLESIKNQTYKNIEVIINDDFTTSDATREVIEKYAADGLNIIYLKENRSMAQGRKVGTSHARGTILIHLDSDMQLESSLIEELVAGINSGLDAMVIPEESFGVGFWAKCKWLEKKCYDGNPHIESLRCVKKEVYEKVGGHNPSLVFSEDRDLDIKVREAGYSVSRTKAKILHNEGHLTLLKTLKKKMFYSGTSDEFAKLHLQEFRWQVNILNRYVIYARNIKYLFTHPLLYCGMIFMKTSEFGCGAVGLLFSTI